MRSGMITVVLTLLVGLAPQPARSADPKPNIVLLLADDLGWGDVGFNGRTEWKTPNLDRLASQGTILRRFYSAAAVCCPSRAAMLTGKSTIHCGVVRNDQDIPDAETTIAEALKSLGYATALYGKWHRGKPRQGRTSFLHPMDQGFDEFFGFADASDAHQKYPKTLWNGRSEIPVEGYADDLFTDGAIDFVNRKAKEPFFLYLSFTNPHFRIEAPADEIDAQRGKFSEIDLSKPHNATYAAMVSRLDRNIGRILQAIDRLGLSGQTLVVFTSDQGATFESGNQGTSVFHDSNRPFRGQKRTLWEGGIRVPALACRPGKIPAATESGVVMHMTDLLPTFVAAAGGEIKPDWKLDGISLLPTWLKQITPADRTLFWEWRAEGSNQIAAMRGAYKLVVTNGGKPELYDETADSGERRDVSAVKPGVAKRLRGELEAWLATEVGK